jgi:hypothetical protein
MSALRDNGRMPWWYARPFSLLLVGGFWVTVLALAATAWLTTSVVGSMSGLRDYNVSSVKVIHERNPIILIRPEWISGSGNSAGLDWDLESRWGKAETRARCGVVFVLWLTAIGLLTWWYWRRRRQALSADLPGKTSKLTG